MAKTLPVAALVVVVTSMIFLALGWGVLQWQTAGTSFLERPSAPVTGSANALESALDAVLGGDGGQDGLSSQRAQLERMREDAQAGLIKNYVTLIALTGLLTLGWTVMAWLKSSKVGGISAMRSARGAWVLGLLAVFAAASALLWLTFRAQGVGAAVTAPMVSGMVVASLVLCALCYWLASALAAPAVLRSSVPLATLLVPVRSTRR